jgi:hypothetical protein
MKRAAAVVLLCLVWWPDSARAAAPFFPGDPLPAGAILRLGSARLRHPARIESLALSGDARLLATADLDGNVRLWDTRDGKQLLDLPRAGTAVVFSHDGNRLAVAYELYRQSRPVRLFGASSRLASGGADGRIRLWGEDSKAGAEVRVPDDRVESGEYGTCRPPGQDSGQGSAQGCRSPGDAGRRQGAGCPLRRGPGRRHHEGDEGYRMNAGIPLVLDLGGRTIKAAPWR